MKKLSFILLILFLAVASFAAEKEVTEKSGKSTESEVTVKGTVTPSDSDSIDNLVPVKSSYISLYLLLGFDFLVPGAGHFYQGNYWLGSGFVVLKATGAWSIYYFYNQWAFYRSLYFSARQANEDLDPDHELLFKVPGRGYMSVAQLKKNYDRQAQNMTFAVVGNILVYTVSLVINYVYYKRNSVDSIPTFNLAISSVTTENDFSLSLGYTFRL